MTVFLFMAPDSLYSVMMRAAALLAVLLVGCSGSPPTAPSPVPSRVTLTGTITDTVTGAQVGSFSQEVDRLPVVLPVSAAGFLTRQAWIMTVQPTVDLIPETGFDLTFYRQLVRGALDGRMEPIRRWTQAPSIYLQTAGLSPATVAALEHAARTAVYEFSGRRLGVQAWETGHERQSARGGWIVIESYRDDGPGECGRATIGGGEIRINTKPICVEAGYASTNLAHEIGHAMGFWHVPLGLMQAPSPRGMTAPSPRERHHAALAYARQPGNRDIDQDTQGTTTLLPRVVVE